MTYTLKAILVFILCSFTSIANASLEYDSQANRMEIYGPYLKYNILKLPYSVGRFQFELDDIRLESTEQASLNVVWPRFLLSFGEVQLIDKQQRVLLSESFSRDETGEGDKYSRYKLSDSSSSLLESLKDPFQICLVQNFRQSKVKACSSFLKFNDPGFAPTLTEKIVSAAHLNGKKAPKNAQISLDPTQEFYDLELKFNSGFSISVRDKIQKLKIKQIVVDPIKKRIGVVDGSGTVKPTELTTKDRFFSFIKEQNYYRNQYRDSQEWPQDLENSEMEFAPYETGASMQIFGLIVPKAPPSFEFKLNSDTPIATYSDYVELSGTKPSSETLAAKNRNELFIKDDNESFLWRFHAPKKGEMNQRYISLQHKGEDYYFSKRVFRAHSSSIAASLALSTTTTLGIVPGYNFSGEHWFETVWDNSSWSRQRWGIAGNMYETIQGFKASKNSTEKISVNPINFDILYRLKPGVRPVQSTFGLGLRYLNFRLFRSIAPNTETQLLGIGGFWQTAPQKLVDDVFNIVPFFRYPKWMELSLFYYPIGVGVLDMGFSFSWQAKGKMYFSKSWYVDLSFNVNSISLTKVTDGRTDSFAIGTAHGTMGLGYHF